MRNVHASDVLHTLFRSAIGDDAVIETSPPPSRSVDVDPAKGIEAQMGGDQKAAKRKEWLSAANDDRRTVFWEMIEGVT